MNSPVQDDPSHQEKPRGKLRVAAVQYEHAANDKEANVEKIRWFVEKAADNEVRLITFPECCVTGYWHLRHLGKAALENLAEPVPEGQTSRQLLSLAQKYQIVIGAGLIEAAKDNNLYNTYLIARPDGRIHKHRKLHVFVSEQISPGNRFTVFQGPDRWSIGVLICYDNNIIENGRITALMGTDLLLAPHQTGGCALKNPHVMGKIDPELWRNREKDPQAIEAEIRGPKGREWLMRWLPSRAHDQGVFLVFSNGIGVDDDEIRTGNAMILDPYGRILTETWHAGDDMVITELDPDLLDNSTGRQWMKARRPGLYQKLTQPTGKEARTREVRFNE